MTVFLSYLMASATDCSDSLLAKRSRVDSVDERDQGANKAAQGTSAPGWKMKGVAFVGILNPQVRERVARSQCWREFAANKSWEDVVATARSMKTIGTQVKPAERPLLCLCLLCRVLQLRPTFKQVEESLVAPEDSKYARILGLLTVRLLGNAAAIRLLVVCVGQCDYRKVILIDAAGDQQLTTVDAIADELLEKDEFMGLSLPLLPPTALGPT